MLAGFGCSPDAVREDALSDPPATAREAISDEEGRTLAVLAGKTLYLSAVEPADTEASVADQTTSAMERLGGVLGRAGLDYRNVVSCHVHLADMDSYADMNGVYGSYFPQDGYPARTTLEVPGLPNGGGVLLMCVAYTEDAEIEVIRPPASEIPPAMGPYSPAVRAGSTVYVSGQGGRDPKTGELSDSTDEQAKRTLRTIGTILGAAGLTYGNAVLANSYLVPSSEVAEIDGAFESLFDPGGAPSRSNVDLSRLPGDIAVEITFVAVDDRYVTRLFAHDQAPTALSSPASTSGGVVYGSAIRGQGNSFEEGVRDALRQQASVLELALTDLSDVVRVTAYLADLGDLDGLHETLATQFPEMQPAVTAIQAHEPSDAGVALEMIAVR